MNCLLYFYNLNIVTGIWMYKTLFLFGTASSESEGVQLLMKDGGLMFAAV